MRCSYCYFEGELSAENTCRSCNRRIYPKRSKESKLAIRKKKAIQKSQLVKEKIIRTISNRLYASKDQNLFPQYTNYFNYYIYTNELIHTYFTEEEEDDRTLTDKFIDFWNEETFEESAQVKSLRALNECVTDVNLHRLSQEIDLYAPEHLIQSILEDYNQIILLLENKFPETSSDSYKLDHQTTMMAVTNCSNLLRNETKSFFYHTKSLIHTTKEFQGVLTPIYLKAENSSTDLAIHLVKNFSSGALVVVNPIIGVPVLLANYLGSKNKNHQEQTLEDRFEKLYDQYFEQWDLSYESYNQMSEQQNSILEKELIQPLIVQLDKYLTEIEEKSLLSENLITYFS